MKEVLPFEHSKQFSDISYLGIIGGMGTIASSKFHNLICFLSAHNQIEQSQIRTVLISTPDIPDRTKSILNSDIQDLVKKVNILLLQLDYMSISHVIICCYTIHILLDKCIIPNRVKVVSLVDYTKKIIASYQGSKILILCTLACSKNRIFGINESIVYLDRESQDVVESLIKSLKMGADSQHVLSIIDEVLKNYNCDSILLGCTDLHTIYKSMKDRYNNYNIIDPLHIMAYDIVDSWNIANN